ncbi:MAG: response regulator [Candidatus Omnitrophica bacterium]|nr:response regulator [Candidatus Omnitrophota bacterium]
MAKVLIVDDEKEICEEFRDILQDDGHQAEYATSGEEAIRKVHEADYDLIFLDVLMPRMEGRQVFDEIRKIKQIPVAIMSGYMPPNKEKEVMSLGAIACLRKPLDLARIKSLLRSVENK